MTLPVGDRLVGRATDRLGHFARPARGRKPYRRFLFGVCTVDRLEPVLAKLGRDLDAMVGPTRCTVLGLQHARGEEIRPTLDELLEAGQGPDVVAGLAEALDTMRRQQPDREVLLAFATCGVLWRQSARAVYVQ